MLEVYYLRLSDYAGRPDAFFLDRAGEDAVRESLRCRNAETRRTKLLGGAMCRRLLAERFGLTDGRITRGEHGKPFPADAPVPAFFNLSHSGDLLVCALSDGEVGVDVERKGRLRMEVARRFFHPAEVLHLERMDGEGRKERFFRYWSVKESYLKYTGSGLSGGLSGFEVRFGGDGIVLLRGHARIPVYVRECPVDPGYACFVCSGREEVPRIRPFRLG